MDFLNRITIKTKLLILFALVIFLFVSFALFLLFEMNKLGQLTTTRPFWWLMTTRKSAY